MLVSSFVEDLTNELNIHFNAGKSQQNDAETKNHFVKIVQFHVDTKQLSDEQF